VAVRAVQGPGRQEPGQAGHTSEPRAGVAPVRRGATVARPECAAQLEDAARIGDAAR
jgi:hypothetical protein